MEEPKLAVDAPRYWAAALVCAIIAALAGLVAFWAITEILSVELYVRDSPGGDLIFLTAGRTFLVSFISSIVAAAFLHLMMLFVVRPTWFFGVLSLVVLALAALVPFTLDVPTESQVWLMFVNLVVGVIIISLLLGTIPLVTKLEYPAPAGPPPPFQ